ncbi:golgin subfamily A member 6-like protein 6 [Cydia fagiglandana]|uniref:golgin subfamily A member 6-like protein 6 n=1 Tax=Cydia fagiglandana TaxID=1458189 RepID=UPI002FEDF5FA
MVFCYKTITESPRRSPRKKKTTTSRTNKISEILGLDSSTDLASVPEREWRLLAALAKKRKDEDDRERLADQFHKMWLQEKEGREMMEAQTSLQYKRFINRKREDERVWHEHRRMLKNLEQHMQKDQLLNTIRWKERKAEELLAWTEDKKASDLVNRVIEDEMRSFLAAERRSRQESADEWRRLVEVEETKRRADDADKRRNEILRDSSRRIAINSALNTWETSLTREELAAADAARRAQYARLATLAAARGERVTRARDLTRRRARAVAARCELWRDAVRRGSY